MDNREFYHKAVATILFIGMITINALANILPLNGLTTGEVSDLYPSLFTPAGFTFSIWSVIYLLLFLFLVFSWLKKKLFYSEKVYALFSLSSLLNISWVFAWHHLLAGLSVVLMVGLLATLTMLFLHLQKEVPRQGTALFLIHIPFTIYFAWICVAMIANVAAFLVGIEWMGFGISSVSWTIIMISTAVALGIYFCLRFASIPYALVVMWALVGILGRWLGAEQQSIVYVSSIGLALLALSMLYRVFSPRIQG